MMKYFQWLFRWIPGFQPHKRASVEPPYQPPRPPFELLDRHYRIDGDEFKVIGYRLGGRFHPVPYLLRCRAIATGEIVLVYPEYIRQLGEDCTPEEVVREARRRPHEYSTGECEVCRLIGGFPLKQKLSGTSLSVVPDEVQTENSEVEE